MKKFTIIWQWMMILLLSSSVLLVQAQKSATTEKAPVKAEFSKEQLTLLEKSEISIKEFINGTASSEDLMLAKKILSEMKSEDGSSSTVLESTSYVEKILNPDASITVTLGTGTTTNTTTGNPTPYGTYYKNFRQQYLILASELMPLGIGAGDITALGFNVSALNTCVDMPNFTISMKQTSVSALTTTFDNDGYATVFTLPSFLPVVGWNTHTFDTPFTWDGTSNLLIDICTTLIPGAYTQNASVYYTATTGTNTCARYQSDTNPACLTTLAGTVSANRANMQITGEELINPPPGMPYNEVPINGTFDIPVNGDITWSFGNNTNTYDLWFGPAGNMVKVIDNQPSGATGTYSYSNLSFATTYSWQVVAYNANGTTNGPIWNFSTVCGTISVFPWTQGFEGVTIPALPSCWLKENGDWLTTNNASSTYDADAYTGTQFLRESWFATDEYVWTPGFGLDAGTPYDFSFWWAGDNYSGWTGDVFYNTSQSSVGATQLGTSFLEAGTTTTKIYEQVINTFQPAAAGTYYFAIRVNCPSSSPWYLSFDDFRMEPSPSCPMPGTLSASNIGPNSADLIWNSFSGLSDIEFGPAGFTPTGVPTQIGLNSPYNMGGLTAQTSYSFYVRDDCGGGDYSSWAGPKTFTTACDLFTAPFLEDYTIWPPLCWDLTGGTYSWVQYITGVECARANFWGQSSGNTDIMTTPLIDISGGNFGLEFYWSHLFSATYPLDALEVLVSDDNGVNWTQVWYKEGADFNSNDGAGNTAPGTFVSSEIIPLSQFGSPIKVRFFGHSGYGPDVFIDNVNIFEVAYGNLAGTVTKLSNSTPVEGAVINIGPLLTATTGIDGTYNISGILVGNYTVTCSATGYNSQSADITIVEDQTTTQDFSLTAPQIVVNPLAVSVELEPNEIADEIVNISNPGNGPLNWNASLVLIGDETKDPWDLQFSLDLTTASGAAGNAGAECDGQFFYTTRWASNLIHKYDLSGNLIEEFSIPGVTGLRDLAYDGTYFYGGAAANTIYQMDFVNKTLVSSIPSPQPVRNIAYDEGLNGLWVANWATDIVCVSMSGTTLATIPAATHGLVGIYGSAYDNWSAGGPYLWLFDQGAGVGTPQILYQADLNTISMTGFTHDVTADLPPNADAIAGGLFTIPNAFPGSVSLGGVIQGTPDMFFVYELAPFSTWLSISPTSGMLTATTNEDMTLHFDATDMFPGVYQAEIHFGSNPDVGSPVVNVTMTVAGLIPATNLTLSYTCTDVNLVWDMPIGGTPDSWNIYKDGALLGNSTVMTYTDPLVMPQIEYNYYVKAVYAGEESMPTATKFITVPQPGNLQPLGLSAAANTPTLGYVTLEWNESNACLDADGYNIYRDNVQINTTLVTELTYEDGPLTSGLYAYKVKAVYYFGESGFSNTSYALITVGIEETNDDLFRIFPNPVSNVLTIESTIEFTGVRVISNSGQVVLNEQVTALNYKIDVTKFDKGIYFISLDTEKGKVIRKMTVN